MNKRKTKAFSAALLAAAVLALAGCAQKEKAPESAPAAEPTIEATAEPTAQAVTEPAAEPTVEAVTEPVTEPAATTEVTTPVATTAVTTTAEPADVPKESDEANQKAQEQEAQAADDKPTYTTDGIPLTTYGDLTAPVKPTKNYKLPKNAQLEFTGDASTALTTELPDGCVWTPTVGFPNGYTDAAGNYWLNNKRPSDPADDGNENAGYYDPNWHYHATQDEIDFAVEYNRRQQEIIDNPINGEGSMKDATQADFDELNALLGI